jgi:hypothetical protein
MAPPSCNGPPAGLLQCPLRVATVHPLDCCDGPSEWQRSTRWTVAMTPPSCNGRPPGPLQWPFRFATVRPRTVAMAPPSCNGPPLGLLQWSLRVATVHPLDCCNGFSELQRSTPWTVDRILFGSGRRDDGTVMFCVCLVRFLLNIKTANAQFAKPQTHILQSNRSVQSTAETSCPPCSVAVALMATGDASLFRDLCSNSVGLRTSRKPI